MANNLSIAAARARIKRRINTVVRKSEDAVLDTISIQAALLAALQKRLAHERSGATKLSIEVEKLPNKIGVKVVAGSDEVYWARWEEFGTVKMAAIPFFFPGYRARKSDIKAAIRNAVRRAVRKGAQTP